MQQHDCSQESAGLEPQQRLNIKETHYKCLGCDLGCVAIRPVEESPVVYMCGKNVAHIVEPVKVELKLERYESPDSIYAKK